MKDKAFKLGYAFGCGIRMSKRLAMDAIDPNGWRTNDNGNRYNIDLKTGTIQAGMGGKFNGQKTTELKKGFIGPKTPVGTVSTSESKKADSHKSLADKIRGANGGTFEHEGKTYQAQSDPEKQAKSIIERQEQIKNRPNIPEGQKYLRNPLKVVRESDKAYAVENPLYKSAQAAAKRGDYKELTYKEREALKNRQSWIWIPKSRATVKDGTVYGMEGWIAKKGDILTE